MIDEAFAAQAEAVAALARRAGARGWTPATSGNFSGVVARDPLRLVVTPSGVEKGRVAAGDLVEVDDTGRPLKGSVRPSAETPIHLAIVACRGARAVAHTHSVWATLLSVQRASEGGLALEGYEMLKMLRGIETHDHREWVPILENRQDWNAARHEVVAALREHPGSHAFLVRGHGLYTWGDDTAETWRHVEAVEFLLEVEGRAV